MGKLKNEGELIRWGIIGVVLIIALCGAFAENM